MKITLEHVEHGDVITKNSMQEVFDMSDGKQWNGYDETDCIEIRSGYKVVLIEE
jgi:hypothetical protein